MRDKETGEIYCLQIENGEWVKTKGECQEMVEMEIPASESEPFYAPDGVTEDEPELSETGSPTVTEEPTEELLEQPVEEIPIDEPIASESVLFEQPIASPSESAPIEEEIPIEETETIVSESAQE